MRPRRRTSAPHQGPDSRSSAPHCRRAARSDRFRTRWRGRVGGPSRRLIATELDFRHPLIEWIRTEDYNQYEEPRYSIWRPCIFNMETIDIQDGDHYIQWAEDYIPWARGLYTIWGHIFLIWGPYIFDMDTILFNMGNIIFNGSRSIFNEPRIIYNMGT